MIGFSDSLRAIYLSGLDDAYYFEPVAGITAAELAMCLIPLLLQRADLVPTLHPLAQRHFRRNDDHGVQSAEAPVIADAPGPGDWHAVSKAIHDHEQRLMELEAWRMLFSLREGSVGDTE